ncbi:MAG: MarR family transcriptional regulator [Candidatus Gracilibacteria bacterium]|nr:MarR family transcriptional regulator [Candidatus Gracilibacteria bacterium]
MNGVKKLPRSYVLNRKIIIGLIRVGDRLNSLGEKLLLKKFGITIRAVLILDYVYYNESPSIGEMKDKFFTSYAAFSKTIRHMEEKGLIRRKKDSRNVYVSLTKAGERMLADVREFIFGDLAHLMDGIYNEDEKQSLVKNLEKFQVGCLDELENNYTDI